MQKKVFFGFWFEDMIWFAFFNCLRKIVPYCDSFVFYRIFRIICAKIIFVNFCRGSCVIWVNLIIEFKIIVECHDLSICMKCQPIFSSYRRELPRWLNWSVKSLRLWIENSICKIFNAESWKCLCCLFVGVVSNTVGARNHLWGTGQYRRLRDQDCVTSMKVKG